MRIIIDDNSIIIILRHITLLSMDGTFILKHGKILWFNMFESETQCNG
jgi:hypothetical protein